MEFRLSGQAFQGSILMDITSLVMSRMYKIKFLFKFRYLLCKIVTLIIIFLMVDVSLLLMVNIDKRTTYHKLAVVMSQSILVL